MGSTPAVPVVIPALHLARRRPRVAILKFSSCAGCRRRQESKRVGAKGVAAAKGLLEVEGW